MDLHSKNSWRRNFSLALQTEDFVYGVDAIAQTQQALRHRCDAVKAFRQIAFRSSTKLEISVPSRHLDWSVASTENPRSRLAFQSDVTVVARHPRTFANAHDRRIVFIEKLQNSFFLRFSHVGGIRVGIEIVGADLKRHKSRESNERG